MLEVHNDYNVRLSGFSMIFENVWRNAAKSAPYIIR